MPLHMFPHVDKGSRKKSFLLLLEIARLFIEEGERPAEYSAGRLRKLGQPGQAQRRRKGKVGFFLDLTVVKTFPVHSQAALGFPKSRKMFHPADFSSGQ